MKNISNRLAKLEEAHRAGGVTIKVIYEHEHTPEEIEAMRQDATTGTLIIVHYVDAQPQSEITYSNGNVKSVGIDMGKI